MNRRVTSTYSTISRHGDFKDIVGLPIISKAVVYNGVIYTSGITGDAEGDVATQTAQVLERLDVMLDQLGSNKSAIVSAQVWLADMADFAAHNAVWDAWVDAANPPARACVGAQLYDPGVLVEIRVVAVADHTVDAQ